MAPVLPMETATKPTRHSSIESCPKSFSCVSSPFSTWSPCVDVHKSHEYENFPPSVAFYLIYFFQSWNILALDGSNWQSVDLFDFQTDIEGPVVENLSKRCGGFLKKLSLRGCKSITDAALKTFAQNCNNIDFLDLFDCKNVTDA